MRSKTFLVVAMLAAVGLTGGLMLLRNRSPSGSGTASAPPGAAAASGAPALAVPGAPAWSRADDPATDGWDSEVWSARAGEQLKRLGQLLTQAGAVDAASLGDLAAPGCRPGPLWPAAMAVAFEDASLRVERGKEPATETAAASDAGAPGLARAIEQFAAPFRGAAEGRHLFKIVRVERDGETLVTRQHLAASARSAAGFIERHATWTTRWTMPPAPQLLQLLEARVEGAEQTTRKTAAPLFADCTESVLGRNASYREQLLLGLNHWAGRIQDTRFFSLLGTPAVAIGDVDGDGLDDLYLGQEGGLPNRLYLQQADGTAVDVSAASGADWLDSTRGVLLVDLDNDGDLDLAAAILGALVIAAGDGRGRFENRQVLPTSLDTMSLAAADFDQDADLDLYLCAYKRDDLARDAGVLSIGASDDFVYHDAQDGAANYLFRNDTPRGGALRFTDATRDVGLDANNDRYSFAAAWEDFDRDGDQDLYVANDFGRNNLYRNELVPTGAARFVDVAAALGAEDSASGMGVTWGDYDRDGWPDLYVSNMFSSAGSRVTHQAQFKPGAAAEVRSRLQRFARGNTLLRNAGGKSFDDVSESADVTLALWAWSSSFIDLNNDGWDDLIVANGYVTTEDTGDL